MFSAPKRYPLFNQDKSTEAVSVLLESNNGEMNRLKLIKLLYLADREAFRRWERPITFDTYYSMRHGQVLSGVLDLINGKIDFPLWRNFIGRSGRLNVRLQKDPVPLKKLNRAEVNLLHEIYEKYKDTDRWVLELLTQKFSEYTPVTNDVPRNRTEIEDLLLDMYDVENTERIRQQLEDQAYLDIALRE